MTDPSPAASFPTVTSNPVPLPDVTGPTSSDASGITDSPVPSGYTIDQATLTAAKGDPDVWAAHLAEFLGHATGTWIDADVFADWLAPYAAQVRQQEARSAAFQIANLTIGETIVGDPGTLLLDLRTEMTNQLRKRAGLA